MSKALTWDDVGQKKYETGVDHGVLYTGADYSKAEAWNGLTEVSETPGGAEENAQYADNIKYASIRSAETFGGTINAFTYPDSFEECNGGATLGTESGITIGQQNRVSFGFCYRTLIGDDTKGTDAGYKLHLIYGCTVSPSEKSYQTVNENPEAVAMSWEFSCTPVPVTGKKPTASLTIDSTKTTPEKMAKIEKVLYGSEDADAKLPLPDEVVNIMEAAG